MSDYKMTIKKLEQQIKTFTDRIKSNEREIKEAEENLSWVKLFADANTQCCKLQIIKLENQLWIEKILKLCRTGK